MNCKDFSDLNHNIYMQYNCIYIFKNMLTVIFILTIKM